MLSAVARAALAAGGGGGPLVSRSQGAQLARRELARPIYHPSLIARLISRALNWLTSLLHVSGPGWLAALLFVVGILAVIAVVWYYAGPVRASRRDRSAVVAGGRQPGAAEHRAAAERFAAAGDYQSAIIERVRAIAADLESRQILPARPGRTAAELGAEIAKTIPAEATAAVRATRLFDDLRYGGRAGSEDGYQQVRDLDLRIGAARIEAARVAPPPLEPARLQQSVPR
jgi:hypothetical protein